MFTLVDTDGYEFLIVSLDNKQWQFEANSSEDRDEWVAAIEQQILNSLQVSIYLYYLSTYRRHFYFRRIYFIYQYILKNT